MKRLLNRLTRSCRELFARIADAVWRHAARRPRAYLACCVGVAVLGHVWLAAFALASLSLAIGLPGTVALATTPAEWGGALLQGLLALLAAGVAAQYFRLDFALPRGVTLTARQAPLLMREVEAICRHFAVPPPHRVVLTPRFQVELVRTPQRGLPLRHTRSLLIGLPVLQTHTSRQVRALLAAGIGKDCLRRAPVLGWLNRLRRIWPQFARARVYGTGAWLATPLRGFFAVHAPVYLYLTRHAAALHALEGERYALEVMDDAAVAEAIAANALAARFLERAFWPKIRQLRRRPDAAPVAPHASMGEVYQRTLRSGIAAEWLQQALGEPPRAGASTPDLTRRLDMVSHHTAAPPPVPESTAAQEWLHSLLPALQQALDRAWMGHGTRPGNSTARTEPTPAALSRAAPPSAAPAAVAKPGTTS